MLNPEDGQQIPPDTDANRLRNFTEGLRHEILLKRGCDLLVANIIRVDGEHSDGDTSVADCNLFEPNCVFTADWDGGNESSYDWTKDSMNGNCDPLCAVLDVKPVQPLVAESIQTNVRVVISVYCKKMIIPNKKNRGA